MKRRKSSRDAGCRTWSGRERKLNCAESWRNRNRTRYIPQDAAVRYLLRFSYSYDSTSMLITVGCISVFPVRQRIMSAGPCILIHFSCVSQYSLLLEQSLMWAALSPITAPRLRLCPLPGRPWVCTEQTVWAEPVWTPLRAFSQRQGEEWELKSFYNIYMHINNINLRFLLKCLEMW